MDQQPVDVDGQGSAAAEVALFMLCSGSGTPPVVAEIPILLREFGNVVCLCALFLSSRYHLKNK